MRIYLTSVEESLKAEQIQKIIKMTFPDYTVTVIPNKYATEKGKAEVKKYQKEYYQKNREKIVKELREKRAKAKLEKEMAIMEEHFELTEPKKTKERER